LHAKHDEPFWRAGRPRGESRGFPEDRLAGARAAGGERRGGPHIANGAGIAADPTLTGVWMTFRYRCLRRTFGVLRFRAMLGARCLASRCPVLRPACQRFVTGARAGIQLSLRLALRPSLGLSLPTFAAAPSLPPRPRPFTFPPIAAAGGLRRSAALAFGPGLRPVRRHRVAPILELSRLAFGRSLLHAVSRSARGQMSPPPSGSKPR
jgi:hypothetical protein